MSNFKIVYILLIISILLLSCKTKKKLIKLENAKKLEIYTEIVSTYINYQSLLIKSSVKFESSKKKLNLKATVKIKKDSLIIISLSPGLGIEVARIKFTNDSIFILDRLSSQLTRGDYQYISKNYKIDIDYADIQSILTNELFIYPRAYTLLQDEFVNSFSFGEKEKLNLYRKTKSGIENLISIDEQTNAIKKYIINDIPQNRNLSITFEDNYSEQFNNIPKKIFITSSVNGKYNKINLNYTKVSKNKSLNFSFKVPSKYKIIDIKK